MADIAQVVTGWRRTVDAAWTQLAGAPVPGQPIGPSQITYSGKGSYGSGPTAVSGYIDQALDAKGITDPAARTRWKTGLARIAHNESSDNSPNEQVGMAPGDVNNTGPILYDGAHANASRGGWQVTPGTFARFHQPGTSNDIYDPVANAASAINYIQSRYHVSNDGSDLATKVQQADPHRPPHWY